MNAVKAGTTILAEDPFAYNLSAKYRTSRCDFCLSAPEKLFKCSGCCYVYYCGHQCQTDAWSEHKHECAKIKACTSTTKDIPDGLRMMAKIIIKLMQGSGYQKKSFYTKTEFRKFRDLMTHEAEIRDDPSRMQYFETCIVPFLTNFFKDLAPVPTAKEMLQIYGKMAVNSFNILAGEMNSIGTGIYLAASILDHDCQPNAVAMFEGRCLKIRTLVDLPYINWDSIHISYIDQLDDTETRRQSLKKNYYFYCSCGKCVRHAVDEVEMNAALCPMCSGPFCADKKKCLSMEKKCQFEGSEKFLEEFKDVTDFSRLKLTEMSNIGYLDMAKICLKRQENILHPLNLLHVKTLDVAFESAIDLAKFEEAVEFGRKLLPGFIKYQGDWNPLVGILLLKIGKLLSYLQKDEAEDYLRDAQKILKITHGETNTVYKDELMPLLQLAATSR